MPLAAPWYLKATWNVPVKQEILIAPELIKLLYPLEGPSDKTASSCIQFAVVISPSNSDDI